MFKHFFIVNSLIILIALVNGTQVTPSIFNFVKKEITPEISKTQVVTGTSLENGGTESGEIRKIVWSGAYELWKRYPILGTGVETFGYTYYNVRPVEHNLVSEWEYLYNKAHNEYLNYAATTGSLGLVSYSILIAFTIIVFLKNLKTTNNLFTVALLSGYTSILVTNFFGFSVVPVSLQFFLYPAIAVVLTKKETKNKDTINKRLSSAQKIGFAFILVSASYFVFLIGRYWYADYLYAKGKLENDSANYVAAQEFLGKAVKLSPKEAIFWDELSQATTQIAIDLNENGEAERARIYAQKAIDESQTSINLSPANVNIKRTRASMFIKLSGINNNYLINARDTLLAASYQAPTDAQLMYNLALSYVRTGEADKALATLEKTVEIKRDYRNAWLGLALLHIDLGEKDKAENELKYILENIDENDALAKQQLEELLK